MSDPIDPLRADAGTLPPVTTTVPTVPRRRRARRWLIGTTATLTLLVAAVVGLGLWLLRSASGTAELLARLPIIEITGPRGALLGDRFGADRMRLALPGGAGTVDIEALELRGMRWRGWVGAGLWAGLRADTLTARRIVVRSSPRSAEPLRLPASLRLPLEIDITSVQVGELQVDDLTPARAVSGRVHLGGSGGSRHLVEQLQFEWDRLRGSGGRVQIGADAPFALDATLQAQALSGTPWQAAVQAKGPLETLDVQARLRGQAPAGREPPSLDAKAQLRPFAAWPLGTVDASTRGLDLAALASGLPQTRIDGQVQLKSQGAREPLSAEITLTNQQPGRWNEGRVPLQRAHLSLRGNPAQPQRIELPSFDLEFADRTSPAGRWQGQGTWDGTGATIESRLIALRPQRLDARAAAMKLDGPIAITLRGLPSPDPRAAAAAAATAASAASSPQPATGPAPARWDAAAVEADVRGTLDGVLDGAPRAVTLAFDGSASARQLTLRSLRARSGTATAEGSAQAQRGTGDRWHVKSQGRLDRFDPLPWFRGAEGSAWRRGPHRLSAAWTLDLALPEAAAGRPPLQWLQTLQGDGELSITDSLLAGVPVQGRWTLQRDPVAPVAQRSHVQGEMLIAGNRLVVDGRGDPLGSGETDRWRVELSADALAALAPLAALEPALAAWAPRKGSLQATLSADGRWPALRTEGQATLQALQAGPLQLGRGEVRWRLGTGAGQPIDLQAELTQAVWGTQRVVSASGTVRGTVAAHHLTLDMAAPAQPPAWLARMLALRSGAGTQVQLEGDGAWLGAPAGGGSWRGEVQRLNAGVWDGPAGTGTERRADASWLDTRELRAELRFDAAGALAAVDTPSGRATLAGGVVLRWNDVRWRADAQNPELLVQAQIEPVAVAPFLQRAQSGTDRGFKWTGDLRMGARVDVRAGARFDADLSLQREGGDLQVSDGGTPQALGLTEADITLSAHDGVWRFTPKLAGRMLGNLSGAVTVRTTAQQRWPDKDAALEGTVQVQVPNLAVWAGWAPPGWRLEGELATTARLGGRFGAPEYTGELRASRIGLRNLLQGVALNDGEVLIALKGDNAQIERFSVRGGDGTLSATGRASFGSAPQAQLAVTAERFRVLGRVDRQLVVSGQAALALQPERLNLTGKLGVDSGLFDLTRRDAPTLDDDVTINHEGPLSTARPEAAPVSPLMRNASVALDVDLGNKLRLRGRGLDTTLAGALRVSTPGGRLAVNGTVRAENGTYAAYGQKLEIERGIVVFAGPLDSARLDILALRPNLDTRVGVSIAGTALNPRVRLYSEPDMGETDKLSWLVLGRGPDGLGRTDTALLQRAALALLAGEGEGPTDNLVRAIGLDDISVRQTDGEVRETVISLGKQLSRRWYVGYERGVNATTGTWQLIYRIAQRFTLRAQSGLENSLDLIWTWRFGSPMTESQPKPP